MLFNKGILSSSIVVALYLIVYVALDFLSFPIRKDELHFWPTAQFFSHQFVPTLEQLRNYHDLSTPLPFILFGWIELFFHQGIWAGRLFNLVVSFLCLRMVLLPFRKQVTSSSILCAIGLLAFPYFLAVSTHLYTDIIMVFFLLLALTMYFKHRYAASLICFVLAISSRQYAVAFPFALFLWSIFTFPRDYKRWAYPLVSCLSLGFWFWLWKGPAPAIELQRQYVATAKATHLFPHQINYFLACIGVYYVVPETLMFRQSLIPKTKTSQWGILLMLVVLMALFIFFPPYGNPPPYIFPEMGYLDKALRGAFPDPFRIGFFFLFAAFAVIRFSADDSMASLIVFTYAIMMMKAHIAWDKYALPVIAVLWWLKAASVRNAKLPVLEKLMEEKS